jgi:hypothetical protein
MTIVYGLLLSAFLAVELYNLRILPARTFCQYSRYSVFIIITVNVFVLANPGFLLDGLMALETLPLEIMNKNMLLNFTINY